MPSPHLPPDLPDHARHSAYPLLPRPACDDGVERQVREMLVWRAPFRTSGIHLVVRDGTVILSGQVASPYEAREACRLAASVRGVRAVTDQLEVAHPPRE